MGDTQTLHQTSLCLYAFFSNILVFLLSKAHFFPPQSKPPFPTPYTHAHTHLNYNDKRVFFFPSEFVLHQTAKYQCETITRKARDNRDHSPYLWNIKHVSSRSAAPLSLKFFTSQGRNSSGSSEMQWLHINRLINFYFYCSKMNGLTPGWSRGALAIRESPASCGSYLDISYPPHKRLSWAVKAFYETHWNESSLSLL